ncbi:hypothetical protein SRHO_G00226920 [Serrasalmus rhombeus]
MQHRQLEGETANGTYYFLPPKRCTTEHFIIGGFFSRPQRPPSRLCLPRPPAARLIYGCCVALGAINQSNAAGPMMGAVHAQTRWICGRCLLLEFQHWSCPEHVLPRATYSRV